MRAKLACLIFLLVSFEAYSGRRQGLVTDVNATARTLELNLVCDPPSPLFLNSETGRRDVWYEREDTCQEISDPWLADRVGIFPSFFKYKAALQLLSKVRYGKVLEEGREKIYCTSTFQILGQSDYTLSYADLVYKTQQEQSATNSQRLCYQEKVTVQGSPVYGVPTELPKGPLNRVIVDHPCDSLLPVSGLPWSAQYQLKMRTGGALTQVYVSAGPFSSTDRRMFWNIDWPNHPQKQGADWSSSGFNCRVSGRTVP